MRQASWPTSPTSTPPFFGLSPSAAEVLDPQQRMLLECSWQALEAAGIDPLGLRGAPAGVFVGIGTSEYAQRLDPLDASALSSVHQGTGNDPSFAAGRVSWFLGLRGPAMSVSTACSSSLVAVDLAVSALRAGRCRVALAGGANTIASPEITVLLSQVQALSPTGQCRPFDAAADGYVRGEGAAMFALMRLSDAQREGREVWAVVRGSAVNHDGRSSGLTTPSSEAQQAVIADALHDAGVEPAQIDLLECHGTGTPLGDPIEVRSAAAVYGQQRPDSRPLWVGSVKSQLGHLEAAAGAAALAKVVLALRHERMPATLHVTRPNPALPLDDTPLALLTEARGWPQGTRPRLAAVSAFGLSGTNAHLIVEQAPHTDAPTPAPRDAEALWLSAGTDAALRRHAAALADAIGSTAPVAAVAATLGRRPGLGHRASVLARDPSQLRDALRAVAAGVDHVDVQRGTPPPGPPTTGWLFTGQGSQRPAMGLALAAAEPAFRRGLHDALDALAPHLDFDLAARLHDPDPAALAPTYATQPALFALQVGLVKLWRSWGVEASRVIGHSVGEIAAAWACGIFQLDDAAHLVAVRGRAMANVPGSGSMAAVATGPEQLGAVPEGVVLAAINGRDSVVVSGPTEALLAAITALSDRGLRVARLDVADAFHSPRMASAAAALGRLMPALSLSPPHTPMHATAPGDPSDPAYWPAQVLAPVNFSAAVRQAHQPHTHWLELGPRSVLARTVARCLDDDVVPQVATSLDDRRSEPASALWALGSWFALGGRPSTTVHRRSPTLDLPTTPFDRSRHWIDSSGRRAAVAPAATSTLETLARTWVRRDPSGPQVHQIIRVHLVAGLDPGDAVTTVLAAIHDALAQPIPPRLCVFTEGAADLPGCAPDVAGAAAAGLLRSADREHPELQATWIDLGGADPAEVPVHTDGEREIAWRDGVRWVARLTPLKAAARVRTLRTDGATWITGGLGGLARHVARRLATAGVTQLLLTSRRGLQTPGADAFVSELAELGTTAHVVPADMTDPASLRAALQRLTVPLRGVVHTAGVLDDGLLAHQTEARIRRVLAAKVQGALHLDALTADRDLDWFVLFGSLAGEAGAPGQAPYGAANAALTAIARGRHTRDLPGTCVAWGPWAGAGMAGSDGDHTRRRLAARGVVALDPEHALDALQDLASRSHPAMVLAQLDRDALRAAFSDPPPSLWAVLLPAELSGSADPPIDLRDGVRRAAARVLGIDASALTDATPLSDAGLDSLAAVDLRTSLVRLVGRPLSATIAFDHPTIDALVRSLEGRAEASAPRTPAPQVDPTGPAQPIAVVGMACRFPGADTPAAFWDLVLEGRDATREIPADRYDIDAIYDPERGVPGKTYVRRGGYLDDVGGFDCTFFGVPPLEASVLDPQQRVMLEVSQEAMEHAGIPVSTLEDRVTGVYVGVAAPEYAKRFDPSVPRGGAYVVTGNDTAFAAGRIAHHLGFTGPAMSINTVCSSSLVGVHLAADALRRGTCDLALAGGVSLLLSPDSTVFMCQLQALSPDGRSKTFDAAADGYGRGEGGGMVVLKRLADAQRDGDHIWGVLRGSAVGHDGARSGLTVPSAVAQQEVVRDALAQGGLTPGDVQMLECHGTGTPLGDPIEVRAAGTVYADGRDPHQPLQLGSVKANIGHLEAASGIAAFIKALLAVHHGIVPPNAQLTTLNPRLPLDELPVEVPREARAWPTDGPRRAAVNAFGLSGTNAHAVLESPPEPAIEGPSEQAPSVDMLLLSARSLPALQAVARQVAALSDPLHGVAQALACTRDHHPVRAAVLTLDPALAAEALRAVAEGRPHPALLSAPDPDAQGLRATAHRYVTGAWRPEARTPGQTWIALPTTPWQRQRCWVPITAKGSGTLTGHPTLGRRVPSATADAVFEATWSLSTLPWVADHVVQGLPVVPGAALMEAMAAAAHRVTGTASVVDVALVVPLSLEVGRRVQITVHRSRVSIASQPLGADPGTSWVEHAVGTASEVQPPPLPEVDLGSLTAGDPVALRADLARAGIVYGPVHQGLQGVHSAPGVVLAELGGVPLPSGHHISPPLVDAAFQAVVALGGGTAGIPFSAEAVWFLRPMTEGRAVLRQRGAGVDLWWVDTDDRVCAYVSGQRSRALPVPGAEHLFTLGWALIPAPSQATVAATWEVHGDPALAASLPTSSEPAHVVVVPEAHDATEASLSVWRAARRALELGARLWVVTDRAVCPHPEASTCHLGGAAAWGFARSVRLEHPDLKTTCLDLEPADPDARAGWLMAEAAVDDEREIVRRGGQRWGSRLERRPMAEPLSLRLGGTWLITGGFGGVGRAIAQHLLDAGVRSLVLVGRRGAPTEADAAWAEAHGVIAVAADVSTTEGVAAALAAVPAERPLTGVVHAAGRVDDGPLTGLSREQITSVLAAKVSGAEALHDATADADLDAFVLCSSVAGTVGAAGQAPYAAANAALDALATTRRAAGQVATSVAWGPWSDVGLAAALSEDQRARMRRMGLDLLRPAEGVAGLDHLWGDDSPGGVVCRLDPESAAKAAPLPVWRRLVSTPRVVVPQSAWAQELAGLAGTRRTARLRSLVREVVSDVLGRRLDATDDDALLADLGLDSLIAVDLRAALSDRLGQPLPVTVAFDHPSVEALTDRAAEDLVDLPAQAPAATTPTRRTVDADEPIAIVGLGLRFPGGANTPEAFWDLLLAGGDATVAVGPDRWDVDALYDPEFGVPGRTPVRHAALVTDLADFDASFFGMTDAEATALDPQQRILLQTGWEALERAGVRPRSLKGSRTGFFVGITHGNYVHRLDLLDPDAALYAVSGNDASFAAGRIAHLFGFEGPAAAINTACSSSLVALHLAATALRRGECELALAAGVNALVSPQPTLMLSQLGALARDGRCKPFDADADGYGRGEGGATVVLQRLSDAHRDGRRVLAVLRGSAVNHDGHTSGLTVPSARAQQAVIRAALADAQLQPADVDVLECHGTGTRLGDPIEVRSAGTVYGEGRASSAPLLLGAVKGNVGHLEAAAGIAGLAKVVLSLQHGVVPGNARVRSLNPALPIGELPIAVPLVATPWPERGHVRRAGLSAFGLSGTNAHVVLEAPQRSPPPRPAGAGLQLCVVTGHSEAARAAMGAAVRQVEAPLPALAAALTDRDLERFGAAIVADDRPRADDALDALAAGRSHDALITGERIGGRTAWLFTGQGAQRLSMGRALAAADPVFAAALDEAIEAVQPHLTADLRDILWGDDPARLAQTEHTQPATFVIQVALVARWRAWDAVPDLVAGHSVGEVAAAVAARSLDLADAARLVAVRSSAMADQPPGAMWAISAPEDALPELPDTVHVAVVNAPGSVVISGPEADVGAAALACQDRGLRARQLAVSHAFHTPAMGAAADAVREVAESLTWQRPEVEWLGASGAGGDPASPQYWPDQLLAPVRWADCVQRLGRADARVFVELGPAETLVKTVPLCLPDTRWVAVSSLHPDDEVTALYRAAAHLVLTGSLLRPVPHGPPGWVDLPTTRFQPRRFWVDPPTAAPSGGSPSAHPLLGDRLSLADSDVYVQRWSLQRQPWVADHRVQGQPVVPGAAWVEAMRAACAASGVASLADVTFLTPLAVEPAHTVQITVRADRVRVHARVESGPWFEVCTAARVPAGNRPASLSIDEIRERCGTEVSGDGLRQRFAVAGLDYGPSHGGLQVAYVGHNEALAQIVCDVNPAMALPPGIVDPAFQALATLGEGDAAGLPFEVAQVHGFAPARRQSWAFLRPSAHGAGFDLSLADDSGQVWAEIVGLRTRELQGPALLHVLAWEPADLDADPGAENRPRSMHRATAPAQALAQLQQLGADPAWWVTQRGVAVGPTEAADPDQAAIVGMVRTVMRERPELDLTLVDADADTDLDAALAAEAAASDRVAEVAWRGGARWTSQIRPIPDDRSPARYALTAGDARTLDQLSLQPYDAPPPGPGEVTVAVAAGGLNFRDVLVALGSYPGDLPPLGAECAGTVVAVGAGAPLALGDRVMALAPGLRSEVTVDARRVCRVPASISTIRAAGVPLVFLTALYGLQDLADLQPGETVLVHAAAGGVGMAAVQVARWLGAEVVGTASQAKWPVLRAMDIDRIGSSRDPSFAEAFEDTHIDVVLDALTGEMVDAGLGLLHSGGRFLEMGKADIRDPDAVAVAHPGVHYLPFDLWDAGPDRIAELLAQLAEGFEAGALRPLPVSTWPITAAADAFRFMAAARHTGKLVLRPPGQLRTDGPWLVSGGVGGVGGHIARRLAERGVQELILVSRRGMDHPEAQGVLDDLRALGAAVRIEAVDVCDRPSMEHLVAGCAPLAGLVHAAGVVDDGRLAEQTPERLAAVLGPKVLGAQLLAELTAATPPDHFVLIGSVSGTFGSAGQSPYAAANEALTAIATQLRAEGRHATMVALGAWQDVGMTVGLDARVLQGMRDAGLPPVSAAQGLAAVEAALQVALPAVVATPIDRARIRTTQGPPASAATPSSTWLHTLLPLGPGPRRLAVEQAVRQDAAVALSLAGPDAVPVDRALAELGLDSLLAVELRNALARRCGIALPASVAFDHPTVTALTSALLERLDLHDAPAVEEASAVVGGPDAPVAIVSMACRLPGGADSPEALWDLLAAGTDAIGPVPADRWPGAAASDIEGGFVPDLADFDAAFFGLSEVEARAMDPQHRLLLETAWQALERLGTDPSRLAGSRTGVWVGIGTSEYARRGGAGGGAAYALAGTDPAFAAGRIAHLLGLRGPAVAVNTMCSSSLVALHQALGALAAGEVDLALVGGANALVDPDTTALLAEIQALSPTWRCRAFDAAADGYVRSEGAAMVALRRLSDAQRDGDPIVAVIRGSAVVHDGASAGLTVPSGPAQQAVLRQALDRAAVDPRDVDWLEAHGSGTPLGDPIELHAAASVYGVDRDPDHPLWVGSVKGNVGHLEAAAGMAGLLKAALALQHGVIPAHLHADDPNPELPLSESLRLATTAVPWPASGRVRRVGVSSFGLSGTNAHVVLEEAPAARPAPEPVPGPYLFTLSAPDPQRLRVACDTVAAQLRSHPIADVAHTLATGRRRQRLGLSVVATDADDARVQLVERCDQGVPLPLEPPRVAWLFTGQGSQHPGMLRAASERLPVVREALRRCASVLDPLLGAPLTELMSDAQALRNTRVAQPVLVSVGWALAAQLRAWGLQPDWVAGHSLGELTAAAVAGVAEIEDILELVVTRGRLMGALPAGGAMAAVRADPQAMDACIADLPVDVASLNAPDETVISGPQAAVSVAAERLAEAGIELRLLSVSHAFHSYLVAPMLDAFEAAADRVSWTPPQVPLISALTARAEHRALCVSSFWRRHVREPVRWQATVQALKRTGATVLLELGPRPVLTGLAQRTLGDDDTVHCLPTLTPKGDDAAELLQAVGQLVRLGAVPDLAAVVPGRRVVLPTSAMRRARLWLDDGPDPRTWIRTRTWQPLPRPLPDPPDRTEAELHVIEVADVHAALAAAARPSPQLWVTRAGTEAGGPIDPDAAAVWGLARVLAAEGPRTAPRCVDISGDSDHETLSDWVTAGAPARAVAIRDGVILQPRWVGHAPGAPVRLDPSRGVLVVGGLGGIGPAVCRGLRSMGARTILVTSRRPGDAAIAEAEAAGLHVDTGDVTELEAVHRWLDRLDHLGAPVGTVVHAAGVVDDAPVHALTPDRVAAVLAPKVGGARALVAALAGRPLEHLVLFSSASAVIGTPGQGAYAAGCAWLDAEAHRLRAVGWPATSVAWGPWGGAGMADAPGVRAAMEAAGVRAMEPSAAMQALATALQGPAVALVADLDPQRLSHTGLFEDAPQAGTSRLGRRWRALSEPARTQAIAAHVADAVERLVERHPVPWDEGLFDLGLDSLGATELRSVLQAELGLPLPATLVFDHPTVRDIAVALARSLAPQAEELAHPTPLDDAASSGVAIVGLAFRLPGGAHDLDSLWAMLEHGADPTGPPPVGRMATTDELTPAAYIHDLTDFDPGFFGMSRREASAMDPQQRLLLTTAWRALEHAGIAPDRVRGQRVGVFVGAADSGWSQRLRGGGGLYAVSGNDPAFAAGRLAHHFGLHGPTLTVNTACSSSLVAVHLASVALRRGECDLAIVGGANALVSPDGFEILGELGALSPDGRCRTFDAQAHGYGRAEGGGMIVLSRLVDAQADGADILAVIRGTAVNHDGPSAGLTVPSGAAQRQVLRAALADAALVPSQIDVLECHGTGTALGDPIEVGAAGSVYGDGRDDDDPLWLTSIKAHVGHLEAAAGLAGLVKLIASLRRGHLPAHPTLDRLNPALPPEARSVVRVVRRAQPWPSRGRVRRGAISSFGLSGTNAHVIVELPAASPARGARGARGWGSTAAAPVRPRSLRPDPPRRPPRGR